MKKILSIKFWQGFYVYLKADKLIEQRRFSDAINLLINFLERKKYANEGIYWLLGRAYYGNKEYKLAIECFEISNDYNLKGQISRANTFFYLGMCFYELQDYKEAAKVFQASIDIKHKQKIKTFRDTIISLADLYCLLGRCYVRMQRIKEAQISFNEGLKYDPNNRAIMRELRFLGI